jgi:hypothetical protein
LVRALVFQTGGDRVRKERGEGEGIDFFIFFFAFVFFFPVRSPSFSRIDIGYVT